MSSKRSYVIDLIERGIIPSDRAAEALLVSGIGPTREDWREFLQRLLLFLGSISIAVSVVFFVAYNWNDFGKLSKFALLEVIIVASVLAGCKLGLDRLSGKVSLLVASIVTGALLAFYGQTYQTGADTWELFFNWALLITPWVVVGQLPALLLLWVGLANLTLILLNQTTGMFRFFFSSQGPDLLWQLFLFNALLLLIWELLEPQIEWLADRRAIAIVGVATGLPITSLCLDAIFSYKGMGPIPPLLWAIWIAIFYFTYLKIKPDLFMLAGCCLSGIVVAVSFLAEILIGPGQTSGSFFFLSIVTIGLGAGAATWLKSVHKEWQS